MTLNFEDWPTKNFDMEDALEIIERHCELARLEGKNGTPAVLKECEFDNENDMISVQFADWLVELARTLRKRHGEEKVRDIIKKIFLELRVFERVN